MSEHFNERVGFIINDKIYKSGGSTIGDEPKLQTYLTGTYIKYQDLEKLLECAKENKASENCHILRAAGILFKSQGKYEEAFKYFKMAIDKGLPIIDDGIINKCYDNRSHGPDRHDWKKETENTVPAEKYQKFAIDFIEYAVTKSVSKSFVYLYYLYTQFYPDATDLDRRIQFINEYYESTSEIVDYGGMSDTRYCNDLFRDLLEERYGSLVDMYRMLTYMPGNEESKKAEKRFETSQKLLKQDEISLDQDQDMT